MNNDILNSITNNEEKHLEYCKFCKLVISMSVDAIERKLTYNTYISNLEMITKQMREKFYIKVV